MVKPKRTDEMLQVQIPAATKKDLAIGGIPPAVARGAFEQPEGVTPRALAS
tara:strand:+ start:1676 stop:1828 length:153 start_codon:yes stop_codon:yes gene_type:complete